MSYLTTVASTSTTSPALDIINPAQTTGDIIDVNDANALTTGSIINLVSNSADVGTRTLAQITNDNTAATGTTCLTLQQDANNRTLRIASDASTSNDVEFVNGGFAKASGGVLFISNAGDFFSNTSNSLDIDHSSDSIAVRISHSGFEGASLLLVHTSPDSVIDISDPNTTTSNIINIGASDFLTTGKILNLVSNSANTSTRDLVFIHNDNAAAVGTTVLRLLQDATSDLALHVDSGFARFDGRVLETQGADVASTNDLTLGADGNAFELTGTTDVNRISNVDWQEGARIILIANESVTIKHGIATAGTNITLLLEATSDFSMVANNTLMLMLCSTTANGQAWRELSRAI